MRRIVIRYRTPFGRWVANYGVCRLASAVDVAPTTVYGWLSGTKTPQPARAIAIVTVSGGAVKLEDVFAHRQQVVVREG